MAGKTADETEPVKAYRQAMAEIDVLKKRIAELERPNASSHYIRCARCKRTMHGNIKVLIECEGNQVTRVKASDYCGECNQTIEGVGYA